MTVSSRLQQWKADGGDDTLIDRFIDSQDNDNEDKDLIYLMVNNEEFLPTELVFYDLRPNEYEKFTAVSSSGLNETEAVYNIKDIRQKDSLKSIASTSFLIFMLGALAMAFNQDTEKYVVKPIRDMTNAIRNLAEYEKAMKMMTSSSSKKSRFSSLIKKRLSQKSALRRSQMDDAVNTAGSSARDSGASGGGGEEEQEEGMETAMMQGTIRKLARLLELGFGIAGQEIVRKIIQMSDGQGMDFTKTGGMMINGIFGFAIIHQFSQTLQALEGQTMIYVNAIAQIVHSIVHRYGGAANKNIGNAFLLVWKLPEDKEEDYNERGVNLAVQNLADQALLAFLKIIIEIRHNEDIQRYAKHPEVRKIIGPNWHVSLGFGLHSGWGIEGAIGSRHKIDASYLSPNVNLAARLESGTKQFGVDLLLSDAVVQLLSPTARKFCRQIDVVCVKGSAQPIGLWTYDLVEKVTTKSFGHDHKFGHALQAMKHEHGSLSPASQGSAEREEDGMSESEEESEDTAERILKIKTPISHIIEAIHNERDNITKWERVFLDDRDLKRYRKNLKKAFYTNFKNAFLHYIEGRWDVAKLELMKCKTIHDGDGPTNVLLGVIASHQGQAPPNWGGNRSLTSK